MFDRGLVASRLATLTVTSTHPSAYLPNWTSADDATQHQIEVLERGPRTEEEKWWFDEQVRTVGRLVEEGEVRNRHGL